MEFYTAKQAADRLGVTKVTISRYLREGRIKGFRINGTGPWRIDRASFDAFINVDANMTGGDKT